MGKKKAGLRSNAVCKKKSFSAGKKGFNSNPFALNKSDMVASNPFELRTNREKFDILGKICKHNKGIPGVSRSRSMKKRKATLGREFASKDKNNLLLDHRKHAWAGGNGGGDSKDRVLDARFALGKMEHLKRRKTSVFDLQDDVLTHEGKSLSEMEYLTGGAPSSDDEDPYNNEEMQEEFNNTAPFGGFGDEMANGQDPRKVILMAEQKARKIESLKEKTEVAQLTEKLDADYKTIYQSMGTMSSSKGQEVAKKQRDDYDKLLRELVFEPRGVVSQPITSELDKGQENESSTLNEDPSTVVRNQFEDDEETMLKSKLRSVDGFGENATKSQRNKEEVITLRYDSKGKLILPKSSKEELDRLQRKLNERVKEKAKLLQQMNDDLEENREDSEEDEEDSEEGEEEDDEEGEEEEEEDEENAADQEEEDNRKEEEDNEVEDEEMDENEEEDEEMDENEEDDDDEEEDDDDEDEEDDDLMNQNDTNMKMSVNSSHKIPRTYEEFSNLVQSHPIAEQSNILESLFKNYQSQPFLDTNRRYTKFFKFTVKLLENNIENATEENIRESFQLLRKAIPFIKHVFEYQENLSNDFLKMINEHYRKFYGNDDDDDHSSLLKSYPNRSILILFILMPHLYTIQHYHRRNSVFEIISIFMGHVLDRGIIRHPADVALGLFICRVNLEYMRFTGRFSSSVYNYLLNLLYGCLPEEEKDTLLTINPRYKGLLIPNSSSAKRRGEKEEEERLNSKDLFVMEFQDFIKIRFLNEILHQLLDFVKQSENYEGIQYYHDPLIVLLKHIRTLYSEIVSEEILQELETLLDEISKRPIKLMEKQKKKPRIIKLLEPRVETVFDSKRRPKLSQQKEEIMKLRHKIKRGTKSAIREIRLDNQFIQKIRFKEQMRSDAERMEKVKRIYQEAAVQQGELNALDRQRNRKQKKK